jgi:hypothetical protein
MLDNLTHDVTKDVEKQIFLHSQLEEPEKINHKEYLQFNNCADRLKKALEPPPKSSMWIHLKQQGRPPSMDTKENSVFAFHVKSFTLIYCSFNYHVLI